MLENFITAVSVTLPLVLMLALGCFLGRLGWISKDFIRIGNKLNFNVFLPCSLFAGTYCSTFDTGSGAGFLLTVIIAVIVMFLISLAGANLITKDEAQRGTLISGLFRSNTAYVGVPVACGILGVTSSVPASLMVTVASIICNILTPIGFSIHSGHKVTAKKLLKDIFGNPYIIITLLGFVLMLCHCPQFPTPIHKTIVSLGQVCTPLAMVCLGANLDFARIREDKKVLRWANLLRLVVYPLIGTAVVILLGFRDEYLAAIYAMFACPAATLLFTVSQAMGGDSDLASEIVATGTILSMITMTLGIFILRSMGMF